ncbi:MAG: FAD-dependent monooxygenase [Pseudomonadota bacterium]
MSTPQILIVGAGPAGLACALALTKAKVPVIIIDKNESPSLYSRAISITPTTLSLLHNYGVTEKLIAAGKKIEHSEIFYNHEHLCSLDWHNLIHHYPFLLSLPQNKTEQVLTECLKEMGVHIVRNTTLIDIMPCYDLIKVHLLKEGERDEIMVRYVLGADGAHSAVRKLMGINYTSEQLEQKLYLADVQLKTESADNSSRLFLSNDRMTMVAPIGEGDYRIIANTPEYAAMIPKDAITNTHWHSDFTVTCRSVANFHKGNVFLAGDAAHIQPPFPGLGLNFGIEDAISFTEHYLRGTLDQYGPQRKARTAIALSNALWLIRWTTVSKPFLIKIRNFMLKHWFSRARFQKSLLRKLSGVD